MTERQLENTTTSQETAEGRKKDDSLVILVAFPPDFCAGGPMFFFAASLGVQPYLTLCDPMDCSPPGSSVHGILQAKILEWVAVSFSRGSSQPKDETWVSCVSCMAGGLFTGSHKFCSCSAPGEKQGPGFMAPDLLVVGN